MSMFDDQTSSASRMIRTRLGELSTDCIELFGIDVVGQPHPPVPWTVGPLLVLPGVVVLPRSRAARASLDDQKPREVEHRLERTVVADVEHLRAGAEPYGD